jgi:hypothetical protein
MPAVSRNGSVYDFRQGAAFARAAIFVFKLRTQPLGDRSFKCLK